MQATSYDDLWRKTWGDIQRVGPVHRHTLKNLVRTVSSLNIESVLDVGCGSGENLAALAATHPYRLTGADVSQEALALAKKRVPSARLVQLDIEHNVLADKFDLVMSIQVVEHLLDDVAALKNMAGMAKSFVLISTIQGRMRPSEIAIGHVRNYSAANLRSKLASVGLEVVKISNWGFPFYSPIYRSLAERLPGGPPGGSVTSLGKIAASALYHLYWLNWPDKGDIVTVLSHPS